MNRRRLLRQFLTQVGRLRGTLLIAILVGVIAVSLFIIARPKEIQVPYPPEPFSDPTIALRDITIHVSVDDSIADMDVYYTLGNMDAAHSRVVKMEAIQTGKWQLIPRTRPVLTGPIIVTGAKVNISLPPLEEREVVFRRSVSVEGDMFKSLRIDPSVLLDDQLYQQKLKSSTIVVTLPPSAKKLETSSDGTNTVYTWKDIDNYAFPLTIKWTEQAVYVEIEKTAAKSTDGRILVTVRVSNMSPTESISGLELLDSFSPGEVIGIAPEDEFNILTRPNSDPRLVWSKTIPLLESGESKMFSYTLQEISPLSVLQGTVAQLNKSIVAVSNDVDLPSLPTLPPQVSKWQVGIFPTGWSLDFDSGDHHIDKHGVMSLFANLDPSAGKLKWKIYVDYADRNADDDFSWSVDNTILGLLDGKISHGRRATSSEDGFCAHDEISFRDPDLLGYKNVVMALRGWKFDFEPDYTDHEIEDITVVINPLQWFDPMTGDVFTNAYGCINDQSWERPFKFLYDWSLIAFNDGAVIYHLYAGNSNGGNVFHQERINNDRLKGYQKAIVLPISWSFRFKDGDHHLDKHSFTIRNVDYNPKLGEVQWDTHLNYSDKDSDDGYLWSSQVAILVFNEGDFRVIDVGPFQDVKGTDERVFAMDLNDVFVPVTWTDEQKNGTETGIDCGGASPSECYECIQDQVEPGKASSGAYLYSLGRAEVLLTARWALLEYAEWLANEKNDPVTYDPDNFYAGDEKADRYIEAIAWFVHNHMKYKSDPEWYEIFTKDWWGSWFGPQPAWRIIIGSGWRCDKDFCGDCEDFSILRAALLRSLGFSWKCVFSADHHTSKNQGQSVCPRDEKKGSYGHTYNIVYYKGKYRILDYNQMYQRKFSDCWGQNATDNIWNDHYGKYWNTWDLRPIEGELLMNYPGHPTCPTGIWNWSTYYNDICR